MTVKLVFLSALNKEINKPTFQTPTQRMEHALWFAQCTAADNDSKGEGKTASAIAQFVFSL